MSRDRYAIAPIFSVRSSGVAFDVLESLGTPAVSEAARRVNTLAAAVETEAARALGQMAHPGARALRAKLYKRARVSADHVIANPWLAPYADALAAHHAAVTALEEMIARDYAALNEVLAREAARVLPDYVLLEAANLDDEVQRVVALEGADQGTQARRRRRMLAMYLQRLCAKNDTFSRFGPVSWGAIVPGDGVVVRPRSEIAGRRVELELWVVARLIELVNADPDVRQELAPRLHPHARLEPGVVVRLDEERTIELSPAAHAIASRCDGRTPAHALGDLAVLARLADLGVIIWRLEIYARDAEPLASLLADIGSWRTEATRERWQARFAPLPPIVARFAADPSAASRREILAELRAVLEQLGIAERDRTRTLYAATNPINENCLVEGVFTIGAEASERLIDDAWPWFELWRDSIALGVDRVYRRMHELVRVAPRRNGSLTYSSLARAARSQEVDIERDMLQHTIARATWDEIKRELSALVATRPDAPEWELTADECLFLRRRHDLPPAGELALPSLDLLVAAASPADAEAGRMQWVIGEAHIALVQLQHSMYWCCPDKPALHAAIRAGIEHGRVAARDAGNGAPVHVSPEAMIDALEVAYVGSARPKPSWKVVRPADAEVVVDEARRDIRLRSPAGEDLGSLVRVPPIGMGMHPFFPFEHAPHAPRLRLGNVVVQRRAWDLDSTALDDTRPPGVSAAFLTALERVRAARGIPRWVYARPRHGALGGSYASRDKDNKPICLDLESLVSLDILERRLRKYTGMIVTEMLPTPEQLVWQTSEGRFMFELRTNLIGRR